MKLLIEIPEKLYNFVKSGHSFDAYDMYDVSRCIANGKSFESMLDTLKEEIEAITGEHNLDDYDFCSGLICARKIIDKYKESDIKKCKEWPHKPCINYEDGCEEWTAGCPCVYYKAESEEQDDENSIK